jgi:hypothetical protein
MNTKRAPVGIVISGGGSAKKSERTARRLNMVSTTRTARKVKPSHRKIGQRHVERHARHVPAVNRGEVSRWHREGCRRRIGDAAEQGHQHPRKRPAEDGSSGETACDENGGFGKHERLNRG